MPQVRRCVANIDIPPQWAWGRAEWFGRKTKTFSLPEIRSADLIIVNGDIRAIARLIAFRKLFRCLRFRLVALDVVLRPPTSDLKRRLLRGLFGQVDFFIHYFKDLSGYQAFYGITSERSGYVPFKANLSQRTRPEQGDRGDYVLCFGRSMRDYDLFFDAMEGLPLPGAIPSPSIRLLEQHGSKLTRPIPRNVSVLQDDGTTSSLIEILERAKIVALPIRPENICASGIGTYLNAMLFRKPVIITAGPGTSDVLRDEAVFVGPGDSNQLRSAIYSLWHDQQWVDITAQRGYEYAKSLGGVTELCSRVLEATMKWYYAAPKTRALEPTPERPPVHTA